MPNGNKRRPDTLELEVLRPPTAQSAPQSAPPQRPPSSSKPRRYASVDDEEGPPPSPLPRAALAHPRAQTCRGGETRQKRWYNIGGMFSRNASATTNRTTTTTTANLEAATATLAKPEPSTIDNSTGTILTLSPQNVDDNLPDVAAVLPRQQRSTKRRSRKSHSESLHSIATLANTGEIQLHSRSNSCTKFKDKEAEAEADAAASALMYESAVAAKDKILLTSEPPTSLDNADDITDNLASESKSGLRANLMSFLGKFGIWKNSNCRPQRKRSSLHSRHTTPGGYSAAGPNNGGLADRKSVNISCDFEQFPADNSDEKSGRLANAKEIGKRRLSQIRRRRSSYYYSDNERRIRANDREFNGQFKYADNYIKTSKYTMMTFLPFNLLEQFQRLANFYFLCLLVLQLIPAISSLTPVTTAIPLIGVLTLTAVKDAYDDIQRHVSDSQVNNRKSKALRNGKLVDEKWSGVQVGDVIRMENNQFVAADILLLTTSEPNGLCFIETAELDGETNLKCKQCLTETIELGHNHDQLWNFNAEIICEKPNNLLNKFEGTMMWRNQRYPLDNEKILLRGCVLRNTQWCYGVVVFAGKDTKLMQNSGKTQFKSTGVDRLLNFIIIGIVLFLLSICTFFTLACAIWEGVIGQHFQVFLPWENIIPKNIAQGATVIGLLVFFSYAIVLNTVVPISLYVSVEVIRFVQSFLINWDEKMYYEPTKTHAKARTTTLNEELGQIQYIFSDKTGTLTQNIMTFNKCSINGRTYGDVIDYRTGEVVEVTDNELDTSKYSKKSTIKRNENGLTVDGTTTSSKRLHKVDVHFVHSPTTTTSPTAAASLSSKLQDGGLDSNGCSSNHVSFDSGSTNSTTRTTPLTQPNTPLDILNLSSKTAPLPPSPSQLSPGGVGDATAANSRAPPPTRLRTARVQIKSPLERIGRQASTLSTGSEKVMILGDVATNETVYKKAMPTHPNNKLLHSNTTIFSNYYSDKATTATGITTTTTIVTDTDTETATIATATASTTTTTALNHSNTILTIKPKITKMGSTPNNTVVAITTLSPTSPLSLDKSGTASVVTHLHKTSTKNHTTAKTCLCFPSFAKRTPPSPPLIATNVQITSRSSKAPPPLSLPSPSPRCCPKVCTPFCRSCSFAYESDEHDDDDRPAFDHSLNSSSFLPSSTSTKCDNLLRLPPEIHHAQAHHTFNTSFATSTAHNWTNNHHDQHNHHHHHHHHQHAIPPVDFSSNPEYEPDFRWFDRTLLDAVRSDEEHAHNFFRLLALCHTVMPEYVEGRLEYQAQSPDESALVSAARNFGFVFRSRTPNSITIEVMGRKEEYELLHILDFNNVRKRMSVILRQGDRIFLYCKGADSVIYDRLSSSQHEMKARTQDHLNKFAGEGLRTLVLAERQLTTEFYEDWSKRHMDASVSLDNREDKLGAMYEEVESELELVGVTAIEDKLQDGVPQTIANLQMAGIKIWVLTGDKQETAINIGYSCQLLTDDLADVFIVDGNTLEEVEKQLRQFKESIRIVNRFRPVPLDSSISLNLNGSHNNGRNSTAMKMSQVSPPPPPPPPAISVVTFRWDDEDINKRNKGEPDSAETNELYDSLEKGGSAARNALREDEIVEEHTGFAIVINGHSLVHCLSPELESRFLDIASQCKAVICCRVTPLQKALVVELIKRAKNAVTLAIGDGANDVSMIKAAHIGVGISGQEGLQAVLASDYSIAQFRYLERLLLVHGRWSYYRMCKFLRYFFYKNFAFTLCHCWYSFFCGFSAQTVFDPMFISVYNLFYTSLPVLALGVFEQDVSDKHSLEYPKMYTPGLKSQLFNTKEFVYSVLHGAFSSLILFLIPYGTYHKGVSPDGLILSDHMTLGAVVATILIIDNTAQIALYTSYWTVANHITIWGSLIWYFVLDYFYNYVIGGPYVGSLTMAMRDLTFWATMFITVVLIMIPVLAYKFYLIDVKPSLADMIRMKRRQASLKSRHTSSVMRAPSSRRSRRSLRSGYAFAHQEGFGRLITSGKIMRKLPQEFAFPLGLGSKKVQSSGVAHDAKTNNNNSVRDNKNSGDLDETTSALNDALTNQDLSSDGISPRAPCQDLDTINL